MVVELVPTAEQPEGNASIELIVYIAVAPGFTVVDQGMSAMLPADPVTVLPSLNVNFHELVTGMLDIIPSRIVVFP